MHSLYVNSPAFSPSPQPSRVPHKSNTPTTIPPPTPTASVPPISASATLKSTKVESSQTAKPKVSPASSSSDPSPLMISSPTNLPSTKLSKSTALISKSSAFSNPNPLAVGLAPTTSASSPTPLR